MIFMYSGFSDVFVDNFKPFLFHNETAVSSIALVLQGGVGYEHYLPDYLSSIRAHGDFDIRIIVPDNDSDAINDISIAIINDSEAVFFGGGFTPRYCELYARAEIRSILKVKHHQGFHIGGISAGAMIMNDLVYTQGLMLPGLDLVKHVHVFPHFEEDNYAYEFINSVLLGKVETAYGLETNACIQIDEAGTIRKIGTGRVHKLVKNENKTAVIGEL